MPVILSTPDGVNSRLHLLPSRGIKTVGDVRSQLSSITGVDASLITLMCSLDSSQQQGGNWWGWEGFWPFPFPFPRDNEESTSATPSASPTTSPLGVFEALCVSGSELSDGA